MNEEIKKYIAEYLATIFDHLDVSPTIEFEETEDRTKVKVSGHNLNFLIGSHGTSLYALQHMLALSLFRAFDEWIPFSVDINDYRLARSEKLEEIAKKHIDKVRFFGDEVGLPPMNSFERKVVHEFINSYEEIESFSIGEGAQRRVVLKPIS